MAEEKGLVSKLKENYLNFIESLREKGVPSPHLIVPLVVIIVIGAAFLLVPGIAIEKRNIGLTVKDSLSRPVSGAVVDILLNNVTLTSKTSDSSGKVNFTDIPVNAQVRINAEGYSTKTRSVSELSQQSTISLQATGPPTRDVALRILDSNDQQPINGAFVQLSFANGDFAPQATSDAGGNVVVAIQESQIGQATATVNAPGFESTQQAISQEQIESGTSILITLAAYGAVSQTKGDFTVRVTTNGNTPSGVENALVNLIDVVTNSVTASERTSDDGSVVFQDTSFGQAFTIRVSHPNYNEAEMEFTPTADNNELAIQLTTRTSPASTITLTVIDEELAPLNAVVNLFDANTNSLLESGETNSAGEFTTSVAANLNAYATAYADGYLPSYLGDLRGGSTRSITLQQALPGNSVQLTTVVLQDGFPASNAEVSLYRSGGFFLGIPPFRVGSNGIGNATIPTTIDGSIYRVFANASKDAFYGKSDLVEVGNTPVSLSVNLLAIPANLTITLKDLSTGQLISSGSIEAVVAGLPVSTCTISNGTCTLPVAANKEFSIDASATGYLTYSTTQQAYSPGQKANLTISLFPISLAQGATVTFLGLFDSQNAKVTEVANADTYRAKFAVNLPQNVQQAGFYFQVGDEQTVEESVAAISNFDSNGASFVQSDSKLSTNQSCYGGQSTPNTDDKWAYFSFPTGFVGTKEFSFKLKVSRTAEAGSSFNLHYKAFAFKDNLPLLAPADAELLETLRQKIDEGSQLVPEDTCTMKTFDQIIPVSQQTLKCDENNICTKAVLSDLTSRGSPSTFQPQIAKDFTMEFEVLSPVSIDSAAVATQHFNVKNSQQVLSGTSGISFQEASSAISTTTSATTTTTSGRQFNLPFTSLANKKAKISMDLTPLKVSQSAPLTFILRSGDKTFSIPLILSVSGTNTFTVTAAPPQIPANQDGRVTVVVRDRTTRAVEDASVSLFECTGSSFSGNEPSQVTGDASLNNGQNGRYRIDVTPTGLGEIGVRVESPDFKTFENCLVSISGGDFLSISPDVMEFTGSSIEPQAQQVSVTNNLNEPIQVSTSINCGGDPVPARIFPTSTTIEPNADSTFSIKLLQNTTSNAQCLAYFNGRAGTFKSVQELPISFNVNCPDCSLGISTGSASAPLPPAVTLYATPPFFQDSLSIPLRLSADPTCTLDGFRINYAGIYAAPLSPVGGVLGGMPRPNLWNCAACGPADVSGKSECNLCQQLTPSAYQCGSCQPPVTAPTSSSLPSHGVATCNQCASAFGAYQANTFASQLAYQGAYQGRGVPVNPMFGQMQQPHSGAYLPPFLAPGQQYAFDPAVGAQYRQDDALANNFYGQRFGVQPLLPGSPLMPSFNGYNRQSGFSPNMLRDSLRVDQCTRDAITVSADYSFLGQGFPGTGNLFVTLPDGTRKTIRVNVLTIPISPPVQQGQVPLAIQCGTSQSAEAKIGPDYKFTTSVSLSCATVFDTEQIESVETLEGQVVGGKNDCTIDILNNALTVSCDFNNNDKAKEILSTQNAVIVKAKALSSQNPNAILTVTIKAIFEKVTAAPIEREQTITADTRESSQSYSGSSQPDPSVSLKVFKESDTKNRNDLCGATGTGGKRVESNTKLKLVYSFSDDDKASRSIEVSKQEPTTPGTASSWSVVNSISSSQLQSSSGKVAYTPLAEEDKVFSLKATSSYSGAPYSSKPCEITVTKQTPLVTTITPMYASKNVPGLRSFTRLFPHAFRSIVAKVEVDAAVLKTRAKRGNAKVKIEYLCQNGNKHSVTTGYVLDKKNYVSAISDEDLAKLANNSLEFTKCMPLVDSVPQYQIKVTVSDSKDEVLETVYYADSNAATSDSTKAGVFRIHNYPEAPPVDGTASKLPPSNEINNAPFNKCGRLYSAAVIDSIDLKRLISTGGEAAIRSNEEIAPNQNFIAHLCTLYPDSVGKQFEFILEYHKQGQNSQTATTSLGTCTILNNSESGYGCNVGFSTNTFLSEDSLKRLLLNPNTKVSFKAKIQSNGDATDHERYLCKYWPESSGVCKDGNVELPVSAKDVFSYNPPNGVGKGYCRIDVDTVNPGIANPNVLVCDLGVTDEILLPTNMRFKVTDLSTTFSDAPEFELRYGDSGPKQVDCSSYSPSESGTLFTNQKWAYCTEGGAGSTLGEETPLLAGQFIKWLNSEEIPQGRTVKTATAKIARVKIVSLFSANNEWLKNNYHYNFDLIDHDTGALKRRANYVEAPLHPFYFLLQIDAEPKQGIYVLGVNDVVKINAGREGEDTAAIVRFVGPNSDGDKFMFEIRRRDVPVIQDCQTAYGGIALGSLAGLGCAIPGTNIGICPFVVSAAGAIGGGLISSLSPSDSYSLPVKIGDFNSCESRMTPGIFINVIQMTREDGYPKVCVAIGSENIQSKVNEAFKGNSPAELCK